MVKKYLILLLALLCCFGCTQPNDEESRYEVYESFSTLKENQAPIAKQIKPYYQYASKLLDEHGSGNVLEENYTIVNNRLISATINGDIPMMSEKLSFVVKYSNDEWIFEMNDECDLSTWTITMAIWQLEDMCEIANIESDDLKNELLGLEFQHVSKYKPIRKTEGIEEFPNATFTIKYENVKRIILQYQEVLDLE